MASFLEKRKSTRHDAKGSITLYSSIVPTMNIHASILDVSHEGISFSANKRLAPGTTILYKASMDSCLCPNKEGACQLHSISFVTVKWCNGGITHEDRTIYTMGATYLIP